MGYPNDGDILGTYMYVYFLSDFQNVANGTAVFGAPESHPETDIIQNTVKAQDKSSGQSPKSSAKTVGIIPN